MTQQDARQKLEALYTRHRINELRSDPVQGNFDASHLCEVNRRIFQDLPAAGFPEVMPGQYREQVAEEGVDWIKRRQLESIGASTTVAYSRMDEAAIARLDAVLEQADPAELAKLDTEGFTKAIGQLYAELDYIHPFPDGNSRTLRSFTEQLASEAGYELDWSRFNASEAGRDILYIARDLSVNEIALPEVSGDNTLRAIFHTLDQFAANRALPDLLADAISPAPSAGREISAEREQLEQALTVAPPELRPALDARLNALNPEASREAATDSIYAPESARDIGPAVKDGASADLKDALRGSGIDADEVAARLQITAQNAALEAQWVERDIRSVAAAEGLDIKTDAGRSVAEDKTIEYYNKVEIALAAQLDREQAANLDEAKPLAAEMKPLSQEQAECLKEAVEKALGPEKIAAIERGEAVAIPGLSDIQGHDFAVAYLEAREQFGENHRDAKHAHHGQAVMLEQEAKREQRGYEQGGMDWD